MAKMMETVLYYNPGRPETMKHVAMMKSVLVRMGVRIRNIGPEQVMEKVGYLAGMKAMRLREAAPGQTEPGHKELMGREPEPDRVSFRLYRRRSWY